MDRPQPTDPPDGPVNRIKEYMELEDMLKQFKAGSVEQLTEVRATSIHLTAEPATTDVTKLLDDLAAYQEKYPDDRPDAASITELLDGLAALYEKDPHNPLPVKAVALTYLAKGDWKAALSYLEWYQQIAPSGVLTPSILMLLEGLRKRLNPPA